MERFDIIRIIILAAGAVILLWFALPLIVTHNLNIGAATGIGIGLILIIYGLLGRRINALIVRGWHTTGGRILEIVLIAICVIIIGLAAAASAAMISAAHTPVSPGSTVIVLGARVYQDRPSTAMAARLEAACEYLSENPDSVCIVSGGQGKDEPCTESSVMYSYLVQRGIDPERIYMEDKSTNTQENMEYSMEIIKENGLSTDIAVATDGYHEYRAMNYAREAGQKAGVEPGSIGAVPAATAWWLFPTGTVREMYGILEQWFLK